MKAIIKFFYLPFIVLTGLIIFSSFLSVKDDGITAAYKKAGLTQREAALHLLNRFTFGTKPGDIDEVVKMGLDNWFQQQLKGNLADDALNNRLKEYDALSLSNTEIAKTYPRGAQVLKMAIKDGVINKDSVNKGDKKEYKDAITSYMQSHGLKPQQELYRQFFNQKILRATYSNNQLHEVLTDFWFNHFNVSLTKNDCAMFIPSYERDVIRPNVTSKFQNLLMATAKAPAMLFFLDNFSSSGAGEAMNPAMMDRMMENMGGDKAKINALKKLQTTKKNQGLNENYAREVMELHTLGVDGGYTQNDVTQAAKVLTGWSIYPFDEYGPGGNLKKVIDKIGEENLVKRGYVHEGDFMFNANRHDKGDKVVLGKKFSGSEGYKEGVDLLNMLAHHPSTAKFISTKLAVRFVNDNPPKTLIDKMTKTFLDKDGDIKQVLITMVNAPEFWSKDALREKTKSPFELAISAVRGLNAEITQPYQLYTWINKMGQKIYYYQAPTGFPDRGQYWINTGALLNRMNFGLALAAQRIPGVKINLAALNQNHEPESSMAALNTYSKLIMPERDLSQTINRLTPMLNDPELTKKVDQAASNNKPPSSITSDNQMMNEDAMLKEEPLKKKNKTEIKTKQNSFGDNSMLAQVVGVIIGSPEFQKR